MYKVIYKNYIIDVLTDVKYLRYITKTSRFTRTDKTSADACYASDNKTIYLLQGGRCPEAIGYKVVRLFEITNSEYENIKHLIKKDFIVYSDPGVLEKTKEDKLKELSEACNKAITDGVKVLFDDNRYYDFKLTVEDQLNLVMLEKQIEAGAKQVVYHETNQICKLFSAENIAKLISTANKHKHYHTTYYNLLKGYIKSCFSVERINEITYGIDLKTLNIDKELLKLLGD